MTDTDCEATDHQKEELARIYEHGTGGALQPLKTLVGELVEGQKDLSNRPADGWLRLAGVAIPTG